MKVLGHIAVGLTLYFAQLVCVKAVYISGCPLEVPEHSAEVRITCTDISPSDQVVWQYQPKHHPSSDAATCNPLPGSCINKLSNLMSVSRASETTSVLIISNATRGLYAEAVFTCSTFSNSSLSGSTSCRLNVIYPPEMISFTANDQEGRVTLNESRREVVQFTCIAGGNPIPELTLFKNDKILHTVAGSMSSEKKTTELQYYGLLSSENTDRYKCVANNTAGIQQKSLFLKILGRPRLTSPMIFPLDLSVETSLTVNITTVPCPQVLDIVRLKNGSESAVTPVNIDDFHIQCYNASFSNHVCILKVDYVTEEEEGEYALDVSNDVGNFRFRFHLSAVHSKPGKLTFLIDNSNTSVSMNESEVALTFVCTASGSPRPDVQLKKDNITLKKELGSQSRDRKSTELEYAVMARCDYSGVYTCVASNADGTVQTDLTVEVFCAPRLQSETAGLRIVSADRNWTMHLTALPPPERFEFVGLHNQTKKSKRLFHVDCTPVSLTQQRCVVSVSEPTLCDRGNYSLSVGNSLGETPLPFQLDVLEETIPEKESALIPNPSEHLESSSSKDLSISEAVGIILGVLLFAFILWRAWRRWGKGNENVTTDGRSQGMRSQDFDFNSIISDVENWSEPSSRSSSQTSRAESLGRQPSGQEANFPPAKSQRDGSITHLKRIAESAPVAEQNQSLAPSVPANSPGSETTGRDESAVTHEGSPTKGISELSDTGDQSQRKTDEEQACSRYPDAATGRDYCIPEYESTDALFTRHKLKCNGVTNPGFEESEA